jgi:hypothetical protein
MNQSAPPISRAPYTPSVANPTVSATSAITLPNSVCVLAGASPSAYSIELILRDLTGTGQGFVAGERKYTR